jgi:hypothetical protein
VPDVFPVSCITKAIVVRRTGLIRQKKKRRPYRVYIVAYTLCQFARICDIVAYNKSDTYGLMDARAVHDQRRRLLLVSDRTVAKETKT